MTATTIDQRNVRARAAEPREGSAGAGFHLLPGRVVAYAWLLAAAPIALLQVVHSDLHEHNELPPVLHWLRDTALAVPFAAVAVVAAALLVALLRRDRPGERAALTTMVLWGALAALLFAVLSIPGNQLHGLLFGAEEEVGVGLLEDLAVDAAYALQGALLVLGPIALLVGVPWRGAWRAAGSTSRPAEASSPSQTARAGRSESGPTQETTSAGGAR